MADRSTETSSAARSRVLWLCLILNLGLAAGFGVGGQSRAAKDTSAERTKMRMNRRTLLTGLSMSLVALPMPARALQARPIPIRVHKTPWCGCCGSWVEHLRRNGFAPAVFEHQDLAPIARRLRIPDAMRSCHSAEIGGYFVEGHVPAADIRRLLAERPAALGIAVPGMPVGSPGMEQGGRRQPYQTMLVDRRGVARVFARHG